MLDSLFDFGLIGVFVFGVSIDFIADIRIDKIVDFLLEIKLSFSEEAHIIHPLFIIFVFEADFDELFDIEDAIVIEIVLLKFIFVRLAYLILSHFFLLQVRIVLQTRFGEV